MSDLELEARAADAATGELTFLIADVRGYTRFTRERGDAEAARLARTFAGLARDAVEARGGRVVELRGDEALAVFTSPAAAVRAAGELVAACREEAELQSDLPLHVGVGIDVGEAVPVEDGFRGAALNLVARLCARAEAGQVLVSAELAARAGPVPGTTYVAHERAELKGFDTPVDVLRAEAEHAVAPPTAATAAAPPLELDASSPFVGREREVAWLRGAWRQARRGNGRVLVVSGPAGSGKTRLAAEVAEHAFRSGASVGYAGDISAALALLDAAAAAQAPAFFVLDALDALGDVAAERLASLLDEVERHPTLLVCLVRRTDTTPALARVVAAADELGDGHRRLNGLEQRELRELARVYARDDVDDVPLEAIARASAGLPGRAHELLGEWAEQEAGRRLAAAADWLSQERSQRQANLRFANNVIGLKLARLYAAEPGTETAEGVCPYKGLASFAAEDARLFFGRERLVGELAARTVGAGLLAVVGASGSGKSSAIAAGLVPSLAAGLLPGSARWRVESIRPGEHPRVPPLDASERNVLVVDQFEELFTVCNDEHERAAFVNALVDRARDPERTIVIVSIRGDFVDRCAAYPALAELVSANQVLVGPMTHDELRRAIELPAQRAGLRVESVLVDALLAEVADEPAALPLLSTALVELWRERRDGWLRLDAHRETGGVRGAVARLAEATYAQLDDEERVAARSILLRLSAAGDGETLVRRRVELDEFDVGRDPVTARVLTRLVDDRLLTRSDDGVEVAHEALLREWPRLQGWLYEDAQGRHLRRHLAQAARQWADRGRDSGELYRGSRLQTTLEWSAAHAHELNQLERDFLAAGRQASERALRRLRGGIVLLSILLLAAVAAGAVALVQRGQARRAATAALAQSLGAQAVSEPRIDLAMLLGRAAVALDPTIRVRNDLLTTLLRVPTAVRTYHWNANRNDGVAVSPNGRTLAIEDNDGHTVVQATSSGRRLGTIHADLIGFGPDGSVLTAPGVSVTGRPGMIEVRDPLTMKVRRAIAFPRPLRAQGTTVNALAAAGGRLAVVLARSHDTPNGPVTDRAELAQYDYATGRLAGPTIALPSDVGGIAYLPGRRLVFSTGSGLTVVDARTGHRVRSYRVGGGGLAVSPDGRTAALAQGDAVRFLDLATGKLVLGIGAQPGGTAAMGFTPDGKTLATSGEDGRTLLWDVATHEVRATLAGHAGPIHAQAISSDGSTLYTGSFDSNVIGWDLTGSRGLAPSFTAVRTDPTQRFWSLAVSPDSRTVAVGSTTGDVALWGVRTLRKVKSFQAVPGRVAAVAFGGGGRELLVAGDAARPGKTWLRIWRLGTRPQLVRSLDVRDVPVLTWAAWSPDGRTVAASGWLANQDYKKAGAVLEWDAATGRRIGTSIVRGGYATDVAFAPHGTTVAVGGYNFGAQVLDPAKNTLQSRLPANSSYTFGVAFSPDGTEVATTDFNGTLDIWSRASGKRLATIPDPDQGVTASVAWSPDGKTIALTDWSSTLRLFDVATQREVGPPFQLAPGQENPYVAFTPDGANAVVSDDTGRTWVVPVTLQAWEAAACRVANRNLTRAEWQAFLPGRPYRRLCPGVAG